jgi:hypothetical protein
MEPAIISEWDFKRAAADVRAKSIVRKGFDKTLRVVAEDDPTATKPIRFVASTATVDRYGDTIAVEGWDLSNFARNHVMPWCHNTYAPVVGTWNDWGTEDDALVLYGIETPRDLYDFGWMIGQMFRRGFLFAVSVGFIPGKYQFNEDRAGPYGPGVDFLEQELTECSPVVVPANPEALADPKSFTAPFEKAHAAGLDTSPLARTIEMQLAERDGQRMWIPRAAGERLYKSLGYSRFFSLPAAPASERSMDRKSFILVVECNGDQVEKVRSELEKKARNVGAQVEIKDAADGDGDDAGAHIKALQGLVKDLTPLAKAFGEHKDGFDGHAKAFGGHAKNMGEHCDALGGYMKELDALLADKDPADKTAAASVERGGAPHKLSKTNHTDVKAAHEALTKVLDRHGSDDKPADGGDGDSEDEKALRAELARIKAANAELAMKLTGKVPPKQPTT